MRKTLHILPVFLLLTSVLTAQVELKLQLLPGSTTYTVVARSQTEYLPPLASIIQDAQVTITAPAGGFQLAGLHGHIGQWTLANIVEQPLENPGTAYILFNLTGTASGAAFEPGVEVPLFSFENAAGCTGALEIMNPFTDPFLPPNSLNMPVGNRFVVAGAGGDAYSGNYATGAANCMMLANCLVTMELEVQPDGFYQVSLAPDAGLSLPATVEMIQVTVKVPNPFFQVRDLTNLLPGTMSFGSTARFDSPLEAPGHDYLRFRMNASGLGLALQPNTKVPLFKFANGGSCQGDSVFMVKNSDPFLPPNSIGADIGHYVKFAGSSSAQVACSEGFTASAPCTGCLFTDGILEIDSLLFAGPVACLGGNNGMLHIQAHGANNLEFSIDGGQNWSTGNHFTGLTTGNYEPKVRGTHLGCAVEATAAPVELLPNPAIQLYLDVPSKVCVGSDMQLKALLPAPLPAGTVYQWTGPTGFAASIPDPVIFNINNFQSGVYTLSVHAPGCDPASASASLLVHALPPVPVISSNGPVCFGEKLEITTDAAAAKYEWLSPAGSAAATLALPGLTTSENTTLISPGHPAYTSGNWRVRVTEPSGCTAVSEAVQVNIKPRPQAFAENSGPVCPGGQVQLFGNPLPGAFYQWKKQGETAVFSMLPAPLVANVSQQQTFELLVVQDGCTSENIALTTLSLFPMPDLDPAFSYSPAPDCSPKNLQFTANASGAGLSYQWTGVNGFASQLANPVIPGATAAANGSYQLEVANAFGCKASKGIQVTQVVDPVPIPIVQGSGAACPGGDIALVTSLYSGSQVSYQWFRNGNPIFGQTSNSLMLNAVQPAEEGMYRVRVTVDNCTVQSADLFVDVLDKPVASPDFYLTQPCEGGSLQFFSNTNNIIAWQWTGPGGFSSQSPNPLIYNTQFDDIGAYSLTVTGANGCQATASVVVDGILPVPPVPSVAANSPVCPEGDIVMMVQNPVALGNVQYEWMNGAGEEVGNGEYLLVLPANDPKAIPPFYVKTIVNTCPSPFSDPVPVEVKPLPQAIAWNGGTVCSGETAQLFAAPAQDASYEWRMAGSPAVFSVEQNPLLTVQGTTLFELTVRLNGCTSFETAVTLLEVNPVPVISDPMGEGVYCEGQPVVFSAENAVPLNGQVQYTWTGPGGFIFTAPGPPTGPYPLVFNQVAPLHAGAYTLSLASAEGCTSQPYSMLLEVDEMPAPPVITAAKTLLCQGEPLQLDASTATGTAAAYHWFFNNGVTDFLLGITTSPTFIISSAMPSNSGVYYVKMQVDNCEPPPSNLVAVTVIGTATAIQATNPTTSLAPACEGADIQLEAALLPGATYLWYGPAGFYADVPNPLLKNVETMQAGSYLVLVGLPGCSVTLTASTTVFIQDTPAVPVLSGAPAVCEGTDAALQVANVEAGAVYTFYFGQNAQPLTGSAGAVLPLGNVTMAQAGTYSAIAEMNGCLSAPSEKFHLEVVPAQTGHAFAGPDQVVCDKTVIPLLQAVSPSVGSGHWASLDGAVVVQPAQATTPVLHLTVGANRFVWTLTNGICPGAGADTVTVFVEDIAAVGDVFSVPAGGNTLEANLLSNDFTQNTLDWEFSLLSKPAKGSLQEDGTGHIQYTPLPNGFGQDSFTYQICSMTCPSVCDTAYVLLNLGGSAAASDCFVPNLISPNGDGENDTFIIPCATGWPGSSLSVYNRWGSKVFESKSYGNDWDGSHAGMPLPPGTYFYQLRLNDGKGSMLQGYVAIVR